MNEFVWKKERNTESVVEREIQRQIEKKRQKKIIGSTTDE